MLQNKKINVMEECMFTSEEENKKLQIEMELTKKTKIENVINELKNLETASLKIEKIPNLNDIIINISIISYPNNGYKFRVMVYYECSLIMDVNDFNSLPDWIIDTIHKTLFN